MIKNILLLALSIAVVCLAFMLRNATGNKVNSQGKISTTIDPNDPNNQTLFTIGTNEVVVSKDTISINPGFEGKGPKELTIDAKQYPELFQKDCIRIHVEGVDIPDNPKNKLIYIACQGYDHASLTDFYHITVDPEIAQVVDKGTTSTSPIGPAVYLNNSCINCGFQIWEYKEYDSKNHQFVLVNNKHVKDFIDLLKQYNDRNNYDCYINGKKMTIGAAVQTAQDTDKCSEMLMGPNDIKPAPNYFITIGQLRSIIQNIKRVINGENINIFDFSQIKL